jgi:protein CpxP
MIAAACGPVPRFYPALHRTFTSFSAALTALYRVPPENGGSTVTKEARMNTPHLDKLLLAAVLAVPLAAAAMDSGAPAGPDAGPRAGERRGPPPDAGMDPRDADERDGPRGHGPRGPGFGPERDAGPGFDGVPPYLHGLALSEAQQDRIFLILHDQIPYLRQQDKARDKAEQALFALHGAAKYDDAAAVKLAQAVAQADAGITLSHLRTEQKVLAVLTAGQRSTLDERRHGRAPRADAPAAAGPSQ